MKCRKILDQPITMPVLQTQRMAEIRKCVMTEFCEETVDIVINMHSPVLSHGYIKKNLFKRKCSKLFYCCHSEITTK